MMKTELIQQIADTLGNREAWKVIAKTCIMTRLADKYPDRVPTTTEVMAEADAWLKDMQEAATR